MSETPAIEASPKPAQPTRRGILRGALALLGIGVVGGATLKGAEIAGQVLSAPNSYQKEAGVQLDRKDVKKQIVEVMDNPEVVQAGGVAVRNEPKVPASSEPSGVEYRLPPGTKIEVIPWTGRSLEVPSTRSDVWAAFRDDKGIVRFVHEGNLKNITLASQNP